MKELPWVHWGGWVHLDFVNFSFKAIGVFFYLSCTTPLLLQPLLSQNFLLNLWRQGCQELWVHLLHLKETIELFEQYRDQYSILPGTGWFFFHYPPSKKFSVSYFTWMALKIFWVDTV